MKGMELKEIQPHLYCLKLFHELDIDRVLNEGPWTFEQKLVVISNLDMGMSPVTVPMF